MGGPRFLMWLTGLVTLALSTPAATASGGRIVFSGAVVEPTCSENGVAVDRRSRVEGAPATDRRSCGSDRRDSVRFYSRTVTPLLHADVKHDRLLGYFASYARVGDNGMASAEVIVHTYE